MSEKFELVEELDQIINQPKKLDENFLLYTLLLMALALILAFPKIYIHQQIYFASRDIAKLKGEYDLLQEENKIIKNSVEELRYKKRVLDTMF